MFTTKDFLEYYSTISNSELISILNNKKNYQETAIEAANQELIRRKLTEEDINDAKRIIEENNIKKQKVKEKMTILQSKVKTTGNNILDTLKPIKAGTPTSEKTINVIVIIFGSLSIYQIFSNEWYFSDLKYFYNDPLVIFFIFYPVVILPVSTLTFFMRKPLGWILLSSYLTYSTFWILRVLTMSNTWEIDSAGLMSIFPRQTIPSLLVQLLFFAGTLYVICKSNIRDLFFINKSRMALTLGISWFITFLLIFISS
jgi:hypothetical protein